MKFLAIAFATLLSLAGFCAEVGKCVVTYTFDDGLADQYTIAYPMFRKAGLPATFFIIGSKVGDPLGIRSKAERNTPLMTWDQIRDMSTNGMEIASHGWAHAKYAKMNRDEILADIRRNQVALKEHVGVDCVSFASPFNAKKGADGSNVEALAKEAGLRAMRMKQKGAGSKMTAEQMNALVESAKKKGEWLVFMIHGMARGYDAWENPQELGKHLSWVKEQTDVRVLSFAAAANALSAGGLSVPPAQTAAKLSELFLTTSPDLYSPAGYNAPKAYGGSQLVHYSVVSLWVNALECAHLAGDSNLVRRLVAAFEPAYGEKKIWMNAYRHVDLSIVGAVPLEIAILTGDARAKELGLMYADRQWEEPREGLDWGDRWYDKIPLAERRANWEKGYSPETRLWIDDMYMLTFLQSQAYRLTGERKYIERAGKEMCMYLSKLQRPDGLFDHAPGAPFAWGRGNGWMAAAMAMNLAQLPGDSEWRPPILAGYVKMMEALLKWQRPNGLWGQLVDDPESYDETSATAMFAYAFVEGAKAGVLGAECRVAAARAYNALVARLDAYGNLADVCVGTGWKNDRRHYLTRPRANGDPHGQAPLLWLCRALMEERQQ